MKGHLCFDCVIGERAKRARLQIRAGAVCIHIYIYIYIFMVVRMSY